MTNARSVGLPEDLDAVEGIGLEVLAAIERRTPEMIRADAEIDAASPDQFGSWEALMLDLGAALDAIREHLAMTHDGRTLRCPLSSVCHDQGWRRDVRPARRTA